MLDGGITGRTQAARVARGRPGAEIPVAWWRFADSEPQAARVVEADLRHERSDATLPRALVLLRRSGPTLIAPRAPALVHMLERCGPWRIDAAGSGAVRARLVRPHGSALDLTPRRVHGAGHVQPEFVDAWAHARRARRDRELFEADDPRRRLLDALAGWPRLATPAPIDRMDTADDAPIARLVAGLTIELDSGDGAHALDPARVARAIVASGLTLPGECALRRLAQTATLDDWSRLRALIARRWLRRFAREHVVPPSFPPDSALVLPPVARTWVAEQDHLRAEAGA